jgi:hypothetical protein
MRELHLIVPGLASWRDSPHSETVAMPGLDRLLARGRPLGGETSLAEALCQAFGVARQEDWPLAPITASFDGINANIGYWLRADPVHLQIGMRGMTLLDATHVGLSDAESEVLAASLMPLFREAGWHLLAPAPARWYGHPAHAVTLRTTPLDEIATRHVNSALPVGPGAARAMRLINDAQIILHDHPVNQAREARGLAPINSLWLWGGGEMAKIARRFEQVLAAGTEALALARLSGSPVGPCPGRLSDVPRAAGSLLVLPEFPADAGAEDAARLDADWFVPLLRGLNLGRVRHATLTLTGPEGRSMSIGVANSWKFWNKLDKT